MVILIILNYVSVVGTKDYNYCVKHDCKGFRQPTEYEYCKLGSEHNKIGCFLNSKFEDLEFEKNDNNNNQKK